MAETLKARERALNHEDGQDMVGALGAIADNLSRIALGSDYERIYGFHYNAKESDPSSAVTYLEDAAGMTPLYVDLNTGDCHYGSWRKPFFMPRPCMLKYSGQVDYYLNENDFTLKDDGTPSDVADINYGGNAMMEFPRIWWKIVPDSDDKNSFSFYCSNREVDSSYHAWNCIDKNNKLKDHFYMSIYQGCEDSSGRLRSISGQIHSKNKNASAIMALAEANGEGYQIDTYADVLLFALLCTLLTKSTASQETLGLGHTTDSWIEANMLKSGTMDKKGLFFGNSNSGTGGDGVKIMGRENPFGDQWRWTAGLLNVSGTIKYKLTQGTADGTTVSDYNTDGSGYKTVPDCTPSGTSGGYISKVVATADGVFTQEASGSQSTYFCDGLWFNNSQTNFALWGGTLSYSRPCGVWFCNLNSAPSWSYWYHGSGISFR